MVGFAENGPADRSLLGGGQSASFLFESNKTIFGTGWCSKLSADACWKFLDRNSTVSSEASRLNGG